MKPGGLPKSTWEFRSATRQYRPVWQWLRLDDGRVTREASEWFHSLSEAMRDARVHGFSDAYDSFSIY